MADIKGPILPLQLDPRNTAALVRDTQTKIFLESAGQLNDFSAASPLSAIVEGQAYAQSELLYYLNGLPEAYTLQWLRQLGLQRSIGAKATVQITFTKVEGFTRTVIIPKGTILSTVGKLNFILNDEVRISDQSVQAVGRATAEKWGTIYNLAPNEIQKINVNILGLGSSTNLTSAQGGKDLESIESLKGRAFSLLRRRGLISAEDYEAEISELAPEASIIKVLSYEEREQIDEDVPSGVVAICLGDENGVELETTTKTNITKLLRKKVPLGSAIYLLAPTITPVETTLSVEYDDSVITGGLDLYASQLNTLIADIINPQAIDLGDSFSYQEIFNEAFGLNVVEKVNSLVIRLLKVGDSQTDAELEYCNAPFVSSEINGVCVTEYEATLSSVGDTFKNTDPLRSFRYYKNIITLVAASTQSPLTYTYTNPDYDALLRG